MKSLASLSPLALVLVSLHLGGCAADVDDGEGPSEENVTAANATSHGKAVRKCLDEEMTSTLNPDGAIAAADKSAKCVAAANDKLLSSIDARQGAATGTTKAKFATFRAKTETACLAFASTNGRPSLNRQADCLRDTEEGLARILQSFGNLGGTRDSSLVFGSWGRMQETCFVKWSSTNDGGSQAARMHRDGGEGGDEGDRAELRAARHRSSHGDRRPVHDAAEEEEHDDEASGREHVPIQRGALRAVAPTVVSAGAGEGGFAGGVSFG
ncbi:MAG: hypothetical protein U0174_22500 [Polyangiaceae bacterium]